MLHVISDFKPKGTTKNLQQQNVSPAILFFLEKYARCLPMSGVEPVVQWQMALLFLRSMYGKNHYNCVRRTPVLPTKNNHTAYTAKMSRFVMC